MSPLRQWARPRFRRFRIRPRTFRTQWAGFALGTGALAADTTITIPMLTSQTATTNFGLNQPTIIRIRGDLVVTINENPLPAAFKQASPWIGLAVLDHDDSQPGGNPDDPFSNSFKNEWMFHRGVYVSTYGPNDIRSSLTAVVRLEVDVKSRRRLQNDQTLCLVVTNPPIGSPAASVGVIMMGRILLHEFGR